MMAIKRRPEMDAFFVAILLPDGIKTNILQHLKPMNNKTSTSLITRAVAGFVMNNIL